MRFLSRERPSWSFVKCIIIIIFGFFSLGSQALAPLSREVANAAPQIAAAPSVAITPPVVNPGGRVLVSGAGYLAGEVVVIRLNGTFEGTTSADTIGNFGGFALPIPVGTVPGSYSVTATGAVSNLIASTGLTVQAVQPAVQTRIGVNPSTVLPGARIEVGGIGFQPGEMVIVHLHGLGEKQVRAGFSGAISHVLFTLPRSFGLGIYTISATGLVSGRTATTKLHVGRPVVPGVGLIPNRVHRGGTVLVSGNNLLPDESVLIRFRGQIVQVVHADVYGRIVRVGFVVPGSTPYGVSTVSITGTRSGRTASTSLTVVPVPAPSVRLAISPSSIHRGGILTIAGAGYRPGETVLIRLGGTIVQAVTANSQGAFGGVRVVVPVNAAYGALLVSGVGASSGRTASRSVLVVPVPVTRLGVTPGTVHRGTVVTASGSGFFGGEIVLLRFRGALMREVPTDQNGRFAGVAFRIPSTSPYGRRVISAQGMRSNRTAQTTVDVVPAPSIGIFIAPSTVARGGRVVVGGHGFAGNEIVLLRADGIAVQGARTDAHGAFSVRIAIPHRIKAGTATILATGERSRRQAVTYVHIVKGHGHQDEHNG
jgi:hypothetical protein